MISNRQPYSLHNEGCVRVYARALTRVHKRIANSAHMQYNCLTSLSELIQGPDHSFG